MGNSGTPTNEGYTYYHNNNNTVRLRTFYNGKVIEDTLVKFHHDTRSPETKLKSRKLKFLEGPALKKHKFHQISHAKFPAFGRTLAAFRKGQIEKFYKTSEKNIQKFLEEKIRFTEIV